MFGWILFGGKKSGRLPPNLGLFLFTSTLDVLGIFDVKMYDIGCLDSKDKFTCFTSLAMVRFRISPVETPLRFLSFDIWMSNLHVYLSLRVLGCFELFKTPWDIFTVLLAEFYKDFLSMRDLLSFEDILRWRKNFWKGLGK